VEDARAQAVARAERAEKQLDTALAQLAQQQKAPEENSGKPTVDSTGD